ncbi:LysR family transcriptional regulator [Campylobacter insulaenigrae]|uniref:LysR family transcriptional regulator n=1 Tax=Campylobacter insulaenigrae TaxID=260714 RepID=UPI002152D231|nr:LysR family transcriptional regulator [Campylobacter insulaenigrae]MCR6574059.1 LysR family transcriptional regulator [Campylobacter insulaenigrae]MCR6580317.1 LysR family transcriptional regulator [Campylobacter insulaenigrae]MCR6586429.1 LysR family transcriptional regulator [Campylobacter insulaenigrae]MCR6587597.1 LysR family transcriptional regulator [Campylobacter insulaenigrae]
MTFKQIKYFQALSKNLNLRSCAKELNITQAALSLAIFELEKNLNVKLFDRNSKFLSLNEKGKVFLKQISPLIFEFERIQKQMQDDNFYELSMKVSQNIGIYLLCGVLDKKDDNIKLDLTLDNSKNIIKSVLEKEIDLGVIEGICKDKDLRKIKICDDELIVVSKNYFNKDFFIDELKNFKWLSREKGSGAREVFLNALPKGVDLKLIYELNSTAMIKELVKKGNFLAVLPKFSVKEELENKKLFQIRLKNFKISRELFVIYHKSKEPNKKFINFCEFLIKQIQREF